MVVGMANPYGGNGWRTNLYQPLVSTALSYHLSLNLSTSLSTSLGLSLSLSLSLTKPTPFALITRTMCLADMLIALFHIRTRSVPLTHDENAD